MKLASILVTDDITGQTKGIDGEVFYCLLNAAANYSYSNQRKLKDERLEDLVLDEPDTARESLERVLEEYKYWQDIIDLVASLQELRKRHGIS